MNNFNSAIIQNNSLLPGIHGLRGIAALAVFLTHTAHIGDINPPQIFSFIKWDFPYSVQLFFIISAYSLMHSNESKITKSDWVSDYFIKRFFRIAPLYYCLIIFFILAGLFNINGLESTASLISNLTFTFGFAPWSSIVWGGWSVGVEMVFYAIFPVLILLIRTHKNALFFLVGSIVITCTLRYSLHVHNLSIDPNARYEWSYFTFQSNICYFFMGIYAFYLSKQYVNITKKYMSVASVLIILFLLLADYGAYMQTSYRLDNELWGIGLMGLCAWQSISPSRIIASRFFEFLGERSFSIYLLHPVIIYFSKSYLIKLNEYLNSYIGLSSFFISAVLMFLLVLVFVEITYRFIEVPGIDLGRKLVKSRKLAEKPASQNA